MAQRKKRKKAAQRAISPLSKEGAEQFFGRAYQHLCAPPAADERNVKLDRAVCAYLLLLFHKRYREGGVGQENVLLEWPAEIWPFPLGDDGATSASRPKDQNMGKARETWEDRIKKLGSFTELLTVGRSSSVPVAEADEPPEPLDLRAEGSWAQAAWRLLEAGQHDVREWFAAKQSDHALTKIRDLSRDLFQNSLFRFSQCTRGDRLFFFINPDVKTGSKRGAAEPSASAGEGALAPASDPRLQLFPSAKAAYDHLLSVVEEQRKRLGQGDVWPKKATLIQYVCHHSKSLIEKLLENEKTVVNVYVQHERVAHLLGISHQTGKLLRRQQEFKDVFTSRQPTNVYTYDVPASLSAVCLDDEWIMLGWYTYEPDNERSDRIRFLGHSRPALVINKDYSHFYKIKKFLDDLTESFKAAADPDGNAPCSFGGRFLPCRTARWDPAALDKLDEIWKGHRLSHQPLLILLKGEQRANTALLTAWLTEWLDRKPGERFSDAADVFVWSFHCQREAGVPTASEKFINQARRYFGDILPTLHSVSPWARAVRLVRRAAKRKHRRTLFVLDGIDSHLPSLAGKPGSGQGDPGLAAFVSHLTALRESPIVCVLAGEPQVLGLLGNLNSKPCAMETIELKSDDPNGAKLATAVARLLGDEKNLLARCCLLESEVADDEIRRLVRRMSSGAPNGSADRDEAIWDDRFKNKWIVKVEYRVRSGDSPEPKADGYLADVGLREYFMSQDNESNYAHQVRDARMLLHEVRQQRQEEATQTDAPASSDPLGEIQQRCRQARDECLQQRYLKSLLKTWWGETQRGSRRSLTYNWGRPSDVLAVLECFFEEKFTKPLPALRELTISRKELEDPEVLGVRADDKKLKELGFDDRGELRIGPKLYAFTLMESALELWHVGRLPEAVAAHQATLKDEAVKKSRYDHAKEHRRLAEVYLMMGDLQNAEIHAIEGVRIANPSGASRGYESITHKKHQQNKISAQLDLMVDANPTDFEDINLYEPMDTHVILGRVYHHMGKVGEAEKEFDAAQTMHKEMFNHLIYLSGIFGLWHSELLMDLQGREENVMERVAWSLSRYESQPQTTDSQGVDLLSRAADLLALGQASLRWELDKKTGVFDDARRALEQAAEKLHQIGQIPHEPKALLALAELYLETEEWDKARWSLDQALFMSKHAGLKIHEADSHLMYTEYFLKIGRRDRHSNALKEAEENLNLADGLIQEIGYGRRTKKVKDLRDSIKEQMRL